MQTLLFTLPTGDKVYRYQKSIVIFFNNGHRKVLSTSTFNGGYREDLSAVFNHDGTVGVGIGYKMLADNYQEHMRLVARNIGLDAATVTGMGTAAQMNNVACCSLSYKELSVTAIVTAGVDNNGGRVGDPADYYEPQENTKKHGTINIFLIINADMPAGSMARALVTCTEAKSAALQELVAGSNYSCGLATGSGTDQTIIIANPEARVHQESAGKHSKLGELIGKTVIQAVKEALFKQTGLCAQAQHSVLARGKRFGLNADALWQEYLATVQQPLIKPEFLGIYNELDREDTAVTYVSLYINLLDQLQWQLLSGQEVLAAAQQLLNILAKVYNVEVPLLESSTVQECLSKLQKLLVHIVISRA